MIKYTKLTIVLSAVFLLFTYSAFAQTRLYVGNLSWSIKDQDLENLFMAFGEVKSAHIVTDKTTQRSKGFGFVEMVNGDEAQSAIAGLNGTEVDGRKIVVNEAKPSTDSKSNATNPPPAAPKPPPPPTVQMRDLNGKWNGLVITPDSGELPINYVFKVEGDKLTGTGGSPTGDAPIEDGKINGDTFDFKITVAGVEYRHHAKFTGDTVELDLTFPPDIVSQVTLKRWKD